MKKLKSSESQSDRLSELPDSLILAIISLLPMRDVVRTTLLSKRWKDLWTTIPCLRLKKDKSDKFGFKKFVNGALILWKGTKILKFEADISFSEQSEYSDLDLWLGFAIKNEVEELYLNVLIEWDFMMRAVDTGYWAPQRLYSCSSIRKLFLSGCRLKINQNVQWDQLKCLTIEDLRLSEHLLNQILSGAPQLEVLILSRTKSDENLNIHSNRLKTLKLNSYFDGSMDTLLTIWAPNVETLEISRMHSKCVLMNVSSLTNATVRLHYPPEDYENGRIFQGYKLLEDILGQVYHSTRHLDKVTLSGFCIEMLGEMKKKNVLAPLSNAKSLEVRVSKVDEVEGLFEIFPKLTKLVIVDGRLWPYDYADTFQILCAREPFVTESDTENSLEGKTDFPMSCPQHLTTVNIDWINSDDSILPFIEFLLKCASKLEKLVFGVTESASHKPKSLLLAAKKLLRMPRSSPTAEVILCRKRWLPSYVFQR